MHVYQRRWLAGSQSSPQQRYNQKDAVSEVKGVQMCTLDWLILSEFVVCWKMHVAYKGFAFFCVAVSALLCIYPCTSMDRISELLCCWHREKES